MWLHANAYIQSQALHFAKKNVFSGDFEAELFNQ